MAGLGLKDMEPIWITHMLDPATFWFISAMDDGIREQKENNLNRSLPALSNTSSISENYKPNPGELVAVWITSSERWQRGEVQSIKSAFGSYVFLLDHGTAVTVNNANIRGLPEEYQSGFSASRLHLCGLEITSKAKSPVADSKITWESEAYDVVAEMLRSAKSCYLASSPSSLYCVGNTYFGELHLKIDGAIVNLMDKLVEKKFAVKSVKVADRERSLEKDPYGLSLGSNLSGQVAKPMGRALIAYRPEQQVDEEEMCGIGKTRNKQKSTKNAAVTPVANPVTYKAGNEQPIKFHPAGLAINMNKPNFTRKGEQLPTIQQRPAVQEYQTQINPKPDQSVKSKQTSPVVQETANTSVIVGTSPVSSTEGKRSRRSQNLLQKLDGVATGGTVQPPNPQSAGICQTKVQSPDPLVELKSLEIQKEQTKKESEAKVNQSMTDPKETLTVSPGTSGVPKLSLRSRMLREQIKGKCDTSISLAVPNQSSKKDHELADVGKKHPNNVDWKASGDASSNSLSPQQDYKPSIQPNDPKSPSQNQEILPGNDSNNSSPNRSADHFKFQNQHSLPTSPQLGTVNDMLTMNQIIAHARDGEPEQILTYQEASFPDAIHKVLGKMYPLQVRPSRLQRYVWPAIMRGENVIMVEPPNDKNMITTEGFLVPLISRLLDRSSYSSIPQGNGPIAIILCAGAEFGEEVQKKCTQLLEGSNGIRVVLTHGGGAELERKNDLTNGCEILITTPRCYLRLLQYSKFLVNFNRLCHLVLEKAHVLLAKFQPEVNAIMNMCKEEKRRHARKGISNPLQVITGSEEWSLVLFTMVHDLTPYPLVCISSYVEAAIYANVRPKMDILGSDVKPQKTLDILRERTVVKGEKDEKATKEQIKTVIVCHAAADAKALQSFLDNHQYRTLIAHEKLSRFQLDDVRSAWISKGTMGHNSVLICTDVILPDLGITDALCLIHYNLPLKKTPFGVRFTCLLQNIPNINKGLDECSPRCEVHIFVDQWNREQLPGVVKFMERLGAKVTPWLKDRSQDVAELTEREKVNIPFCYNLKAFGTCWNKSTCKERHAIIHTDYPTNLPKLGRVRLKVLSVLNTSHFSARLLEVTDSRGATKTISDEYLNIAMQMALHFIQPANQVMHGTPKLGDICAVETNHNMYQRALVIAITATDKIGNPCTVKVHLMDNGSDKEFRVLKLLHLPQDLRDVPAQVIDVFMCYVAPSDLDTAWSTVAYDLMVKLFEDADRNERFGTYIVGDIQLSMSNTLWLDPLHIKRNLRTVDRDVTAVALRRRLIEIKMAIKNPEHLERLYAFCRRGDLDIPASQLHKAMELPSPKKIEPVAAHRWAYLSEESVSGIVFLAADNLSQLFIRQHEFYSNLKQLTTKIQGHMAERSWSNDSLIIQKGLVCLGKSPDPKDGKWHRAQVTGLTADNQVELFFVDFGDRATVDAVTSISPMEDRFITYLPFQAIECSLAGIQPLDEGSWDKAIDRLYDLTVDEDGNLIIYNFKVLCREQLANCTGGYKYKLALIDPNANGESVINRILIEDGLVGWNPDEESFIKDLPKIAIKDDSSNNDGEKEDDEDMEGLNWDVSPNNAVATMNYNNKEEDIIKLSDLHGVALNAINETEDTVLEGDDRCIDFEIDNVEDFIFNMMHGKALEAGWQKKALEAPSAPVIRSPRLQPVDNATRETEDEYDDLPPSKTYGSGSGRKPNVTWHQDLHCVHLSIELIDVTVYNIQTEPMYLSFSTKVGDVDYLLDMNFFGAINPESTSHVSTGRSVYIKMEKIYTANWPHLLKTRDKDYSGLKYNIDHAGDGEGKMMMLVKEDATGSGNSLRKEDIMADFQYNDSDTDSGNEDHLEDKPFTQPRDPHDPFA